MFPTRRSRIVVLHDDLHVQGRIAMATRPLYTMKTKMVTDSLSPFLAHWETEWFQPESRGSLMSCVMAAQRSLLNSLSTSEHWSMRESMKFKYTNYKAVWEYVWLRILCTMSFLKVSITKRTNKCVEVFSVRKWLCMTTVFSISQIYSLLSFCMKDHTILTILC